MKTQRCSELDAMLSTATSIEGGAALWRSQSLNIHDRSALFHVRPGMLPNAQYAPGLASYGQVRTVRETLKLNIICRAVTYAVDYVRTYLVHQQTHETQ